MRSKTRRSEEAPATQPSPRGLPLDASLFQPGERVGIAVSGGADSVALLLAMLAANHPAPSGEKGTPRPALAVGLSVVHVHHGIRGQAADNDASFVANLVSRLDLPFHLRRADAPARAASERETLEEAARNVRYSFFADLVASGELDAIATAHTLDDQAETVLMKLLRGAWLQGMSGIHPVLRVGSTSSAWASPAAGGDHGEVRSSEADPRSGVAREGRILRPMLAASRAQVEAYLRAAGQPWCEDATNSDLAHTRNRVRRELMPLLRTFNPKLRETLAHVAALARDEEARWSRELDRILPLIILPGQPVRGGGRSVGTLPQTPAVAIELDRLRAMDPALRRRVLRAAAAQLGSPLGFEHTERLMELCADSRRQAAHQERPSPGQMTARAGTKLELADGLRAERTARELRLWRD